MPLRRANLPNLFSLFDFGDATNSADKRGSTTVATQALFMMNSPFLAQQAASLVERVLGEEEPDAARLERVYLATLSRLPDASEKDHAMTYIHGLRQRWDEFDEKEAWQSLTRVLLSSNEFVYLR